MSKWKKLKGVAYNFSQYCQSGMSAIQPDLSNELDKNLLLETSIQLYPHFETELVLDECSPLRVALNGSIEKFFSILIRNGFKTDSQ